MICTDFLTRIVAKYAKTQRCFVQDMRPLLPELYASIFQSMDDKEMVSILRRRSSGNDTFSSSPLENMPSADLWSKLKILSVSRFYVVAYSCCMMIAYNSVLSNILGRQKYLNELLFEVDSLGDHEKLFPENITQEFKTLASYFTTDGWKALRVPVEVAVQKIYSEISYSTDVTYQDSLDLSSKTRKLVEEYLRDILPMCFVPQEPCTKFKVLFDEIKDIIESSMFFEVITLLMDSFVALSIKNCIDAPCKFREMMKNLKNVSMDALDETNNSYVKEIIDCPVMRQLSSLVFSQFSKFCVQ